MKRLSKWNREQLISFDKEQTLLNPDLTVKENDYKYAEKIITLELNNNILCPFCLGSDKLRKFIIKKKDGINKRMALCPFCKQELFVKTLLSVIKFNAKEFAEWVYNYNFGQNRFFNKVQPNFKEWNIKLKKLNMSYDFWEEYKKLKGEHGDYDTK